MVDIIMIWYGYIIVWLLWGNVSNIFFNDECFLEKYVVGGCSCFNLIDYDYLFGQVSWLIDCYNGY